jgi:hypothetical protein
MTPDRFGAPHHVAIGVAVGAKTSCCTDGSDAQQTGLVC